ncbi:MAG: hypothetical protein OXG81_00050 [Acidobacteria bacterium]|nr:hypothetical protein [Acidobacteriota bacterium]
MLVDSPRSRLLVYRVDEGLVRVVDGRESADPVLHFGEPRDVQPFGTLSTS